MRNTHCLQCGEKMLTSFGNDNFNAPFCDRPECPNYGLLQIGVIPKPKAQKNSGGVKSGKYKQQK